MSAKNIIDTNNIAGYLAIPGYFFININHIVKDSITIQMLDVDCMTKKLEKNNKKIKTAMFDGKILIVDSPEKTRTFISECLKEKQCLENNKTLFWRKKQGDCNVIIVKIKQKGVAYGTVAKLARKPATIYRFEYWQI